jgi:hypothetical protein
MKLNHGCSPPNDSVTLLSHNKSSSSNRLETELIQIMGGRGFIEMKISSILNPICGSEAAQFICSHISTLELALLHNCTLNISNTLITSR